MSRADRFFRRLLRLFPADFRGDFGDDIAATFSEGFVLSAIGGALGLLLAYWTVQVLLSLAGTALPRADSIDVDARVVGFTSRSRS